VDEQRRGPTRLEAPETRNTEQALQANRFVLRKTGTCLTKLLDLSTDETAVYQAGG
jgi:hypothetical protein